MKTVGRIVPLAAICLLAGIDCASAQGRWWDDAFVPRRPQYGGWSDYEPGADYYRRPAPPQRIAPAKPTGGDIRDGGARPYIEPVAPPIVAFRYDYPARSIVIDSGGKRLYYVLDGGQAYAYEISVGREGFDWTGVETISAKREWPDWHPPAEMRERDPTLPVKMTGGLKNPLGALALYLGNTLYRIHGTNDEKSLGRAQSSGCFRMLNANVLHLATLADVGTKVHVVSSLSPRYEVNSRERGRVWTEPAPAPRYRAAPAPAPQPYGWERYPDYRSLRDRRFEPW